MEKLELQDSSQNQHGLADNTVVQKWSGYTTKGWALAIYRLLVVLTGGLVWVITQYRPQTCLWTMQKCSLSKATYVYVKLINGRQELLKVQEMPSLCRSHSYLQQSGSGDFRTPTVRVVHLLLVVYVYDLHLDTFKKLPDMPANLPVQIYNACKALRLIEQGADWSIFNPPASWQRREVAQLYGNNDMQTGRPNFSKMVGALLIYPLYVVQYYELAYKFYERFYQLASCLIFIIIQSGFLSTYALYQKRIHLFQSLGQKRVVPIVHFSRIRAISSRWLVPGDVIVVLPGKATCDMVLLQGNCLVEESVLSGEAAQVRKSSFVTHEGERSGAYHPETHHSCTVHAGTFVQQVWTGDSADDEVLAMVVRTGLRSTMGNMLQQIVAPLHDMGISHDPFIPDMCRFFGFSLVLQVLLFLIGLSGGWHHAQSRTEVVQRALDTVIAAIPVGTSTVIICALGACTQKLRLKGIDVLNPSKLKAAADVSVVCFDKTGTLTGSVPELHGMLPVEEGQFLGMQCMAMRWPNRLKQAAAVCNSLTLINKSQVVGDAADKQAFKAVEARFVERNLVSLPLRLKWDRPASLTKLQVLKRFEFESRLMRSGVVAVDSEEDPNTALLFVRGAPAKVEELIRGGVLPADYHQVLVEYAAQSFRLMALAVGELQNVTSEELAHMTQQDAESMAGRMDMLGLLVLSNHLHPSSKDTVTSLQDKGGIRTMMVTGDYHHTAIAVARGVGMVPQGGQLVIIQAKSEKQVLPRMPSHIPPALGTFRPPAKPYQPGSTSLSGSPQRAASPLMISFSEQASPEGQQGPSYELPQSSSIEGQQSLSSEGQQTLSFEGQELERQQRVCDGLAFMVDSGNDFEDWDPHHALTNIAQGTAQCCVTGPAFEHMLQQADASVVETVMTNVAVFSRMRSQQKGQVMDLLGSRGLFQNLGGQERHIPGLGKTCMYCGDGINDLVALASADVGMAVGSSHASAAASVSDRHSSVAGVVTVLREARSSHVIKLAVIKYMVVYELLLSVAVNLLLFVDGSRYSVIQRSTLDFVAISLGVVASLRPAAAELIPARPPQQISSCKNFVLLLESVAISVAFHCGCLAVLYHEPWFSGSTSENEQNPVVSAVWPVSLAQILTPAYSFSVDVGAFCQKVSRPEILLNATYLVFSFLCAFVGPSWFDAANLFKFYHFKFSYTYKSDLVGWCFLVVFLTVLPLTRKLWDRYEQRVPRISPVSA